MSKKKIHFIVNPISGKGKNLLDEIILSRYFEREQFEIKVLLTTGPDHATVLALASLEENADVIVACGGDGTISEVASCLVGKEASLGIIPFGSGNGLASNLGIPKKLDMALKLIKKGKVQKIDVGQINDQFFFSNMGLGFDANLIQNFDKLKKRQLLGYIRASWETLKNFKNLQDITIASEEFNISTNPFLLFISNSNMLGYGFSLTPEAKLEDGLLDILVVEHLNKSRALLLGLLMLTGKHKSMKEVNYFQLKNLSISSRTSIPAIQKDGCQYKPKAQKLNISILPQQLSVIVP
ncbi:diacylglycerol kinase family lipid kinase [Echinicola sp. CAU 1574]|uniref:Diacylglycerol kinase family lipid kinase n=1 Tax=Echinicola arenosa TaxID=2774144 RepID=A0ABR9ANI7_9BACT|nr:diacylglycerol kinase family protein [Echinicola arenosa]MBD8490119.1 diacylglycerol kinase family lipid kinase [Echinicola arenosa]